MEPGLHGLELEENACSGGIKQPKRHFPDQLDVIIANRNDSPRVLSQKWCQLFVIVGFNLQYLVALVKSDKLLGRLTLLSHQE
jgi:hypothetical protein